MSVDDADQEASAERSEIHDECKIDPVDGRDRAAELAHPAAGHTGIPVDAVCTGDCKKTRIKRAPEPDDVDVDVVDLEASDLNSFKHVCHSCQRATWWNPISVLTGLMAANRGDDE